MVALTLLRYSLLLLVIPSYFLALSRRSWSTIPLWLVSTSAMLTQFWMAARQGSAFGNVSFDSSLIYVGEMTKIMVIPMVVQLAVVLRGMSVGVGGRAIQGSRKLVEILNTGER